MPTFAIVRGGQFVETRVMPAIPPSGQIKHENGIPQLRPYTEVKPSFDPEIEALDGPAYGIADTLVTATWTKRDLTAPELSAAKAAAVNGINGAYKIMLKALLSQVNEDRTIKAKINALITEISATTPKFAAGQTTQITMAQLKTALEALL